MVIREWICSRHPALSGHRSQLSATFETDFIKYLIKDGAQKKTLTGEIFRKFIHSDTCITVTTACDWEAEVFHLNVMMM